MAVAPKDLKEVQECVKAGEEEDAILGASIGHGDERKRLLQMSEISLWLDNYDDIFSDFDPRPYSQRSLSDDFLAEAKKASKEKTSGKIELRFLIPSEVRDSSLEGVIRKRLHEHFRKHASILEEEIKVIRRKGITTTLIGMSLMSLAAYVSLQGSNDMFFKLTYVFIDPAGWFITWFGLDQVFYTSKQKKPDLEFYFKMAKSDIEFMSLTCPLNPETDSKK